MCNNVPEFSIVSKKAYQLNHLFSQLIFINNTILHHKLNMLQEGNIIKRIFHNGNNVCQFSFCNRARSVLFNLQYKSAWVASLILVPKSNLCISFFILHFEWYQMPKNQNVIF